MADRLAALAVAVPFLVGSVAGADGDPAEVLRFRDPAIVESSGLVAWGGSFLTVNDSGDTGRVFLVDGADGRTTGVTTWAEAPVDVEALAPAGPGRVWVGDIGDNAGTRPSVEVALVRVGGGARTVSPTVYPLGFPDGPVDAEALLRHPRTGRLFVVTKEVLGGRVYAAPTRLVPGRSNRLRAVGDAPPIVTDGAFFPDGRHLLLRDYGRAMVYTFPGLERVAEVTLPDQQQGEGIAIDDRGRVYVSSEGRSAPLLEVLLPVGLRAVVLAEPAGPSAAPSAAPPSRPGPASSGSSDDSDVASSRWPWFLGGGVAAVGVGVLVGAARRRRPAPSG